MTETSPSKGAGEDAAARSSRHFLQELVARDVDRGQQVHTRFPPEPNGYLHVGHAKAIWVNFSLAAEFGGLCNLRFDDTNPTKENEEFVDAIQRDVRWLGFDWDERLYFTSSYFEKLYELAEELIRKGVAYVCDLSAEEMREHRGSLTEPGRNSPFRDRGVEENLDLFRRMRAGEFPDGARSLRAKIDMASPNVTLRDPVMYRILHAHHHRTGDTWCIYPTYDWAHGQSDALEGITHSICTLEFENHRPLYDWFLDQLDLPARPRQIEFARMNPSFIVTSKRKLRRLVEEGFVQGWDDPRMPTLSGLRRRGYPPEAIRAFCERTGVTRVNGVVDYAVLENCVREDLNKRAPRRLAVLRPLKVVIENWPEGQVDELEAVNNPEDPTAGSRKVPFSRELYIDRDDFREDAPRKFFRLAPGREVRLRYAYYVTCTGFEKDPVTGEVTELRCTYDPETRGGDSPDGRKVKGTIHWVSAEQAKLEPDLATTRPEHPVQFERQGYFLLNERDSTPDAPVFHRIVALRDTWAKIEKRTGG